MKVLINQTFVLQIVVEIPDGLSDDEARNAATNALDSANIDTDSLEWVSADFFRPAISDEEIEQSFNTLEDGTPMTEWFDVG